MKIFLLIFLQIIFLNVCKCLEINKIQKSAIEIRKTTNGKNINNINIVAPVDNETDIIRKKRSSINRERLIKVRLEEEKNLESSTKGQELKRFDKKVDEGNKDGKINGRKVVIGEDNDKKLNEENGLEGLELHREGMMEEKVKEKKQLNIKENNEKDEDEDGYNEEKVKMNEVDVNRMDEEGEEDTQENIYENAKGKEIDKMNEVDEREENMEEKVGINKLNEEEEEEEEEENIKGKFKANGGNNANKLQNQQIVEENKINEEKMEMDEELFEINNENNEIKNKRWGRVEESYFSEELSDEVKDKEEIEKLKEIEKENKNEKKIGIEEKERQIFKFGDEFNNNNNYNKQQIDKKQFFGLKDNFGENNIQQKFNEYKQQPQQLTYNSYLNLFNPDEELNNEPLPFGFNQQNPPLKDNSFLDFGFYQQIQEPNWNLPFGKNNYLNNYGEEIQENIYGMNDDYYNQFKYQHKQYQQQKWDNKEMNDYIPFNYDFGGSKYYYEYDKLYDNKYYFDPMEKDKKKR